MSVLLSACRHTKQRALARALKKRAEKQKLKKEAELAELEASALEPFARIWAFTIKDEYYEVMLYLASDKDTVEIFCNEDEVTDVMINVCAEGATFDFLIGASYKGRIDCRGNPKTGLVHTLTVEGHVVPEAD